MRASRRTSELRKWAAVGALVLAAAWLTTLIWGLAGKARIAMQQEREAREQFAALESRKATLEHDLAELETERGQDGAIRTAFGVAKEGEEVIVVVPPDEEPPPPKKSWWSRWFGWF